jgi:hypothetical protein
LRKAWVVEGAILIPEKIKLLASFSFRAGYLEATVYI